MKAIIAALSPAVERVAKQQHYAGDRPAEVVLIPQPSSRMSTLGHCVLVFTLYAAFITVIGIEIAHYVNSVPRIERGVTVTSRFARSIPLSVTPRCMSPIATACGVITLTVNYTNPETPAACKGLGVVTTTVTSGQTVTAPLCYVPDEPWTTFITNFGAPASSGVYVSFSPLLIDSPPAIVDVSSNGYTLMETASTMSSVGGVSSLAKRMNVGHAEVRTLLIGAQEKQAAGSIAGVRPYAASFETDGYRMDNRSDVFLRLNPFAEVENSIAKESVVELIAGFGGAFKLLRVAALVLVPVFFAIFAKQWTPRDKETSAYRL